MDNYVITLIVRARDEMANVMNRVNKSVGRDFRNNLDQARASMRSFDKQSDTTTRGLGRLTTRLRDVRNSFASIRGPTDGADRSMRGFGNTINRIDRQLASFKRRVDTNRESIAKFDNEIRGMRVLIIAAQMQALASAVVGLGGALTGVAGSAIAAGAALGGALAAGAAQAIPAVGLLAATLVRLKQVFDVVQQVQDAQKAQATQATSATNKQADSMDRLANASDGVRDASQRVQEAQRGVAEAHREARRELVDLTLAQRAASLQQEQSEDRLRQLRSAGTTGFALRAAELDVDESRVGSRRATQELTQARTATPEGVRDAVRSLRDAQEALNRSRRGMANARRDAAEGGVATVAAARQLDFMQAQLSDAERRLVKSIINLKDTWRRVSGPITDTIVDSFTRAVDRTEEIIQRPTLIGAFQNLADKASNEFDRIFDHLTNDRAIAFWERSTDRLAENLRPASNAAMHLADAFMNIADAAAPTLERLFERFERFTNRVENITQDEGRLREIFEFGETQLDVWLRLAGAVGKLIVAIIAPGGNLNFGAAASGARTIADLTERIQNATEWINSHPLEMNEFFGDSEQVFQRILDLLEEIGKVFLQLFDPESVDAFADIIEGLLPSFELAAEFFGQASEFFAFLINTPIIREFIQGAFGFLFVTRIADKFFGLLTSLGSAFLGAGRNSIRIGQGLGTAVGYGARLNSTIAAASVATGGLVARIEAGTIAWRNFGVAAATATRAGVGGAVGGAVFRGGSWRDPTTGRQVRPPGAATAPPPAPTSPISNTLRGGFLAGAGGAALGGARFAGRALLPIAGFLALIDALSARGNLGDRTNAAVRGGTFGAVGIRRQFTPGAGGIFQFGKDDDPAGAGRTLNRFRDALRQAVRDQDIERITKLRDRLRNFSRTWGVEETEKKFDKLADATERFIRRMRNARIDPKDILNQETLQLVLKRIDRLRTGGAASIEGLERNIRITSARIEDAVGKGSKSWATLMTRNFGAGIEGISKGMETGEIKVEEGLKAINRLSNQRMKITKDHMEDYSFAGRTALARNFAAARRAAERQIGNLETATGEGLKAIKKLLAEELSLYGFDRSQIRNFIQGRRDRSHQRSIWGGSDEGAGGNRNIGGIVGNLGERGRDGIRTLLGRGEAVLNWGQQKVVEPALNAMYGFGLTDLFKRTKGFHAGGQGAAGFARGGIPIVPVPGFPGELANRSILDEIAYFTKKYGLRLSDAYGPGHQSPGHTVFGTAADLAGPDRSMNAAVRELVRRGYKTLYDGNFGSIAWPGHGPSTVAGSNAHIHVEFGSKDANFPNATARKFEIPRVGIRGAGAIGMVGNAALEFAREAGTRAARKMIREQLGGTEGSEFGVGPGKGAATRSQMVRWATQALHATGHGASPGAIAKILALAMKESSWIVNSINNWDSNARAGNPSGGLMHVTIDKVGGSKRRLFDPVANMIASINYQFQRYGGLVTHSPYAQGGVVGDMFPDGSPIPILAHAGEWVLNKAQQIKMAAMSGLSRGNLKQKLGFSGGPTGFQGGGEIGERFQLPNILPSTFGGNIQDIVLIINLMSKFEPKMKGFFKALSRHLDFLTGEGGYFDRLTAEMEEESRDAQTRLLRRQFIIRRGRVVRRNFVNEDWVARATIQDLIDQTQFLRRMGRVLRRSLGQINRAIAAIRRGGVDEDEQDELANLIAQRRNVQGRRRTNQEQFAENLRARFEEQERLKELRDQRVRDDLARADAGFARSTALIDFQEKMQAALGLIGLGGRTSIFQQRGTLLQSQLQSAIAFRDEAAGRGMTDTVDELNVRILDLIVAIQENTSQLFQARIDEVNRQQQIIAGATTARSRIFELQAQIGIISPEQSKQLIRQQIVLAGEALAAQGTSLLALLGEARAAGDEARTIELEQAVLDNTVAQLENTVQLKELDGTLGSTQSFTSTAWQWFRTAIFTGSGGLLPQFDPVLGTSTGLTPTAIAPDGSIISTTSGGGGTVIGVKEMNITQNETVDYEYLGKKVAWEVNTPTT